MKNKISIFTLSRPLCIEELNGINIIGEENWKLGKILSNRCKEVLMSKNIPITTKIKRILYTIAMRVGIENYFLDNYLFQPFKNTFENFDMIIIVSEASKFRRFACNLNTQKKYNGFTQIMHLGVYIQNGQEQLQEMIMNYIRKWM